MNSLKEIAFVITPFIATCAVMYLIGSFVSASFNPQDWSWMARTVCAIWAMSFGFMLLIRIQRSVR